jgi:slime mold repeat-containing protein
MLALLFILLLLGPCAPTEAESLFCEGASCEALEIADGAGGATGADPGEGGAGGSEGPPPCECDDGNPCNGFETCAGDGSCITTSGPTPLDDDNACTDDHCEDGAPVHREIPLDDGDPCTKDYCDPDLGVVHSPLAACMG